MSAHSSIYKTRYDVLVVGTGTAGLLAAYRLLQQRPGTSILLVDAGLPLQERVRLAPGQLEGYGGAGLYLGGRLYLGSFTIPVMPPGTPPSEMRPLLEGPAYDALAGEVETLLDSFGAQAPMLPAPPERLVRAVEQAAAVGIEYITSYPARHLTVEERHHVLLRLETELIEGGADVAFATRLMVATRLEGRFLVTLAPSLTRGSTELEPRDVPERVEACALVLAPGRYGTEWLVRTAGDLGAKMVPLPSAFGVRVEVKAETYAPLASVTPDPRLQRALENDALVKTYATCPGGLVVPVIRYSTLVASGVPLFGEARRENTTFAVLVQPGAEGAAGPWRGGDIMARLLNERYPGKLVVQRLADVRAQRETSAQALASNAVRPTCDEAVAGTLFDVYPAAYWSAFDDFLGRIDQLAPGTDADETLVYGPAEERFWYFPTDANLQTSVPGLFVAGDAPGQSQGVIQAGVAGMLAGGGVAAYLDAQT